MITRDQSALLAPVERDLRLDLFRGIGLWMIFLDHIPHDVVAWLTLRNYGFSDAAEFFVFISGYLVGWIYGPIVAGGWFVAALKRQGRFAILAETVVTSGRKFREHSFLTLARLTARLVFFGSRGVRSRKGLDYWYEPEREKAK